MLREKNNPIRIIEDYSHVTHLKIDLGEHSIHILIDDNQKDLKSYIETTLKDSRKNRHEIHVGTCREHLGTVVQE